MTLCSVLAHSLYLHRSHMTGPAERMNLGGRQRGTNLLPYSSISGRETHALVVFILAVPLFCAFPPSTNHPVQTAFSVFRENTEVNAGQMQRVWFGE